MVWRAVVGYGGRTGLDWNGMGVWGVVSWVVVGWSMRCDAMGLGSVAGVACLE